MKTSRFHLLCVLAFAVGAGSAFAANPVLPSGDAKKLADRYALTKTRIQQLLGVRQKPEPLPAGVIPNPFYKPLPSAGGPPVPPNAATEQAPQTEAPDLSDADTLTKFAATLKVSGYLTVSGQPHVAINGAISKVGDVVQVGTKEHPIFLHVDSITPQDVTLRLNDATQSVPLRK